jgi:hypothetical protein
MWEHPFHFPLATWTALREWGAPLWPELIGILGWQDIVLLPWTYIVLTALLLLVPLQKLPRGGTRARVAIMTGFAVLDARNLIRSQSPISRPPSGGFSFAPTSVRNDLNAGCAWSMRLHEVVAGLTK